MNAAGATTYSAYPPTVRQIRPHRIADQDPRHALARCRHLAGGLQVRDCLACRFAEAAEAADALLYPAAVDADVGDADEDLGGTRLGLGEFHEAQYLRSTDHQPPATSHRPRATAHQSP